MEGYVLTDSGRERMMDRAHEEFHREGMEARPGRDFEFEVLWAIDNGGTFPAIVDWVEDNMGGPVGRDTLLRKISILKYQGYVEESSDVDPVTSPRFKVGSQAQIRRLKELDPRWEEVIV